MKKIPANDDAIAAVSAVVVNYNAGQLLLESVRAALAQARQVVVVDNASSDHSLERLESCFYGEPRLQTLRNTDNFGFAAACNQGFAQCRESRILFLNPDCVPTEGALQQMVDTLEAHPETGMVGGMLLNADGTEQSGGRRAVPTPWRSFVRAFGLHRFADRLPKLFYDFHLHKQPLPEMPVEVEAVSGACMLVKREAVEDVGLWDEGYFLHCEDLDWCMRFRQKGWKIVFVPEARIYHALGACSRSRPLFVEWHKHRGMLRFYGKFFRHHYPGVLMWLVTLGIWLRFGLIAAYSTVRRLLAGLGLKHG